MKNDKNKPAESIPLEEVAEHVHAVLHAVETGKGIVAGVRALSWIYEKFGAPAGVDSDSPEAQEAEAMHEQERERIAAMSEAEWRRYSQIRDRLGFFEA